MKNIVIALLCFAFHVPAVADQIGGAAPLVKGASEGEPCQDEGTLNDLQASAPLICTNGAWRKVVFKDDGKGATKPLYYEGKCSIRFADLSDTKGKIVLKAGELADICLPVGWRVGFAATTNSVDWKYQNLSSIPNIMLIKAATYGVKSTLWIYPVTNEGRAVQKFEIKLISPEMSRSRKK